MEAGMKHSAENVNSSQPVRPYQFVYFDRKFMNPLTQKNWAWLTL